jgi:DHA1 family bicyclomycin/chloramphenicol resistance-like MFS transporter
MPLRKLLGIGLAILFAGTAALLVLVLAVGVSYWTLTVPLLVLSGANGIVTPLSLAGAVSYRPLIAGSSSGLSSAIGLTLSGAFTIVAGALYTGEFLPIAVLMTIVAALTVATGWMTR